MKTQIIQIEAHDDYISVRDKMDWAQTPRILLVWPQHERALNRHFDLVILKRYSIELGAQLALVCKDREIRAHARQLGLPIFPNIRKAQQSYWRTRQHRLRFWRRRPRASAPAPNQPKIRTSADLEKLRQLAHPRPPAWLNHILTRLLIFTVGVLAVLAIAALFIPSATIQISPATRQERIDIQVQASPQHEQVSLSGLVPAVWQSVIVEGRASIPASGSTQLPNQTAGGEVFFTNLTDQTILIPAGIVVATQDTEPIRFMTTQAISVPVGTEAVNAPIQAVLAGSQGNLVPGKIVVIEGPLGLNLTVTNRAITRGGSNFTVPAPAEADFEALYTQLFTSLQTTALQELQADLQEGDALLETTPELVQTLEVTYTPEDSQPSDQLQLTLRLEFRAPVVHYFDLLALGQAVLEANLPVDYFAHPDSLNVSQQLPPIVDDHQTGRWEISAEWQIESRMDPNQVVRLVLGMPADQALQRLETELGPVESAQIQITPDWWPRLPILPFRIQVLNPQSGSQAMGIP